jgi:hypothetical protein
MAIDLKTVDEHLAKAKEEAEFWEKARAVLADPRLKAISADEPRPANGRLPMPFSHAVAGVYGELRKNVLDVLPEADASIAARVTTRQIVELVKQRGYTFAAKEPEIAVNGALMALEEKGLAESAAKRGNAKLWRKKRQKTQEAPEGAS